MKRSFGKWSRLLLFCFCFVFLLLTGGKRTEASVTSMQGIPTVTGGRFIQNSTNKRWYYRTAEGTWLRDTLAKIDDKIYYFAPNRSRMSGLQIIGNHTYCFGTADEGYMYTSQWYHPNTKTYYYFKKNGRMAKRGWLEIDGKLYYFNKAGKRCHGFRTIDQKQYFLGTMTEGFMYQNAFAKVAGAWYYCGSDGVIVTGNVTIDGYTYYFEDTGKAYTGVHVINGIPCYFNEKGQLIKRGADLTIDSPIGLLMNQKTGKIIFSKNSSMRHANASTTKILTAILAIQRCNLTDVVTISKNAADTEPSKLYMKAGDHYTVEDLLYGMMLPSANDVAVALAEHISKTEAKFATLMNRKAAKLGCINTHFATASGLDDDVEHYTTAEDLAKIAAYGYKLAVLRKVVSTMTYSFSSMEGTSHTVNNINTMLKNGTPGVNGMKTGFTDKAGTCFVGSLVTKRGNVYISVVLGSSYAAMCWEDSETLLSYAYNNL